MQLKPEQLSAHLQKGLHPIYVVYGEAPLLVIESADAIYKAAKINGFDERVVLTVLPHFDWSELVYAGASQSLFGGKTLIDLRIPTGKPGKEGSAALQKYLEKPASLDSMLVITLPHLDWTEEKAVWFQALLAKTTVIKCDAPPLAKLPEWIAARLAVNGQKAEVSALRFIAERVEGNLLAAHQEIQKLALLYPAKTLTLQEVEAAVLNVARYDLNDLREALLAGDIGRFSRTLEGLRQEGEATVLVLWALTEEIRALLLVKTGLLEKRPAEALLKEAKVWGARATDFKKALMRLSLPALQTALSEAGRADLMIKGIHKGEVWDLFLRLGLLLAGNKNPS